MRAYPGKGGGPSPRVRGIQGQTPPRRPAVGSIPAGAGNPLDAYGGALPEGVHPRGCGESMANRPVVLNESGPSPRVRGIPTTPERGAPAGGSIPAGAGNPSLIGIPICLERVHPRGCGESGAARPVAGVIRGPSPRVRGIRRLPALRGGHAGSIPAGAGNPSPPRRRAAPGGVHPRGCGESVIGGQIVSQAAGPSPRVRGIPIAGPLQSLPSRSIPAGAGNPVHHGEAQGVEGVHPRGCGESQAIRVPIDDHDGPSPRVRGIPGTAGRRGGLRRSIPAGAGNP